MIKQSIARLLDTELERTEFIKLVGFGLLAATGITQVVKAMTKGAAQSGTRQTVSQGYGDMSYGGK